MLVVWDHGDFERFAGAAEVAAEFGELLDVAAGLQVLGLRDLNWQWSTHSHQHGVAHRNGNDCPGRSLGATNLRSIERNESELRIGQRHGCIDRIGWRSYRRIHAATPVSRRLDYFHHYDRHKWLGPYGSLGSLFKHAGKPTATDSASSASHARSWSATKV